MTMRPSTAVWLALTLAGCSYTVSLPHPTTGAACYDGAFTSFCVVNYDPKRETVVTGSGIGPALFSGNAAAVAAAIALVH